MTRPLTNVATGLLLASAVTSQTWTQVTPTMTPSQRRAGAMEFSLLNAGLLTAQ